MNRKNCIGGKFSGASPAAKNTAPCSEVSVTIRAGHITIQRNFVHLFTECIFEILIKGVVIHNKTPDKLKRSAEKPTFVSFDILERKSMKSSCKHYLCEVKVFFCLSLTYKHIITVLCDRKLNACVM